MISHNQHAQLVLHKLEFPVSLGWGDAERAELQTISVDIFIDFLNPPTACQTDDLTDTFCYDTLQQMLRKNLSAKEFCLIEHIAYSIHLWIKQFLLLENQLAVCVTKYPNAFFKSAGVSFWYSDNKVDK